MSLEQPALYNYDKRQRVLGLITIFLTYGTMSFSIQALNIARPIIAANLDGMAIYAWSVSIPGLAGAVVTLIFGKLSDMYGRRIMLIISLILCIAGSILSVLSTNFVFFIAVSAIRSFGIGAIMPLVFAIVGDMFAPVQRAKWIGLLQLPLGIASLFGPILGGWFAGGWGWQYLFWITSFLFIICLFLVPIGIPALADRGLKRKIDIRGCLLMIVASSTAIIGISLGGVTYPWLSRPIIILIIVSVISWTLFFLVEYRTKEPLLDPIVLRNRSFNTVVVAGFLGLFGQMGMMMYFPMFLQGVQGIDGTLSGVVFTPYPFLMALVGVPAGFILAKTRRYKWMYITGYAIVTIAMFSVIMLDEKTPVIISALITTLAGLGLGAIPTVNTMVIQNAVPKRILGAAMGASFFCLMMGVSISPAVLGSIEQSSYTRTLAASLPDELTSRAEWETMTSLIDSQVLLSAPDMERLENSFKEMGSEGEALFQPTVEAIRKAMSVGIKNVFWFGAIATLLSFLLITTIPEVPIGSKEEE
ncbi:MFS transporter [Thermodesulfobacteriota bacterium]